MINHFGVIIDTRVGETNSFFSTDHPKGEVTSMCCFAVAL